MTEQTEHTTSRPAAAQAHIEPAAGIGATTGGGTQGSAVQDDVSGYYTTATFPAGGGLLPAFGVGVQYCRPPENDGGKPSVPREQLADRSLKGG